MLNTATVRIDFNKLIKTISVYLGTSWMIIESSSYFIDRYYFSYIITEAIYIILGFGLLCLLLFQFKKAMAGKLFMLFQITNTTLAFLSVFWHINGKELKNYNFFRTSENDISIAVMPFYEANKNEFNAPIAFSLHNEIISKLNSIDHIDVKSHSAVSYFKEKSYTPVDVAKSLGVTNLIEGNIVYNDSTFHFTISLIDAHLQSVLWTNTYVTNFSEILNFQTNLGITIAEKLRSGLTKNEKEDLSTFPTQNIEAYNYYMRGRYNFNMLNPVNNRMAHDYFEKATMLDPEFTEAYAYQAMTYTLFGGRWLGIMPDSAYRKVKFLIDKSFQYNPDDALGHFIMAQYLYFYERKFEEGVKLALMTFPKIKEQDDHILFMALMLNFNGKADNAAIMVQSFISKNPTSSVAHQAMCNTLLVDRKFEKAIEYGRKSMELDPSAIYNLYYIAECQLGLGNYEEAIKTWELLLSKFPYELFVEGYFRTLYRAGHTEKAMEQFDLLDSIATMPFVKAKATATLGDVDKTIEYLEQAYEVRDIEVVGLWRETGFDSLRNNPEIKRMMKKFNLNYLEEKGLVLV
ncbi:MAG: tetratricopeptide repeat protein, partial [Cyclobacteriaceae bacterium]|nr:tetratricopeptide repeat protein [Cyclobacteriaceae bacterium]